ncbi:MAG: alpha/beta fold hydrolase, partial [Chitinophagaceae bacterium]
MRSAFVCFLLVCSLFVNAQKIMLESVSIPQTKGVLAGTLLYPQAGTTHPLVIVIAGSGPTDRDGNNPYMKNNSLKMLAEALVAQNVAVFRFDKRGIGQSAGASIREDSLSFDNYVQDVKAWVENFSSDKRFDKIILAGHSEGALLGMIVTADLPQLVDGFISIAGAGRPANKILREQLSNQPPAIRDPAFLALDTLEMGRKIERPPLALFSLFRPSVQP